MGIKRIIGWALGLLLLIVPLGQSISAVPDLGEDYLKLHFNGSILVAEEGKVLLRKGYGMADFKKKKPNTPETVFKIASLTKQFTAMAILMLEEQGKLNTADSLSKYIPDYPNGDKVTIHNLLTHTSGISEYFMSDELIASGNHYYTPEALISLFKNKPFIFTPGEKFQYCNSNYILLGYIIEKVSGMKYKDFIHKYIFAPLDMKLSGYKVGKTELKNEAVGYYSIKTKLEEGFKLDMSIAYAAGGLYSTVDDLYKWDQALYTDKLVKKNTLMKMYTPFSVKINYGYGWYGMTMETTTFGHMFHTGVISGFSSYIYRNIEKKTVIIMLSNVGNQNLNNYLYMVQL